MRHDELILAGLEGLGYRVAQAPMPVKAGFQAGREHGNHGQCNPTVKITGEFWAQTTEGDGNFNMFPFLEREGAEVLVEPIATWIAYMLNRARSVVA